MRQANLRTQERAAIIMAALQASAGGAIIYNGPGPNGTEPDLALLRETAQALSASLQHIHNQCKSIEGRARAAGRDLTKAEQTQIDAQLSKFDEIDRELRSVRVEIAQAEAAQSNNTPLPRQAAPNPIGGTTSGTRSSRRGPSNAAPRTFDNMFGGRQLEDNYAGRFDSFGEFALAVTTGNDHRLIRNAGQTVSTGADGGFAVPLQFLGPVLDAALQMEIIRPRANVVPMTSKQGIAGVFDYSDGTSGKRAGLQMLWGKEATAMTEQKGKVREIELNAHKGSILVRVSNELAADAIAFDQQLNTAMVQAVAAGLDLAFISGTGAGMPLGILNSPTLITVTKESGQAANTLLLQNLAKMVGRLSPSSYANSLWLVHPTLVPLLYTLAVVVQNVAGTENVGGSTAAAVTVDANGQLRIYGRPAMVTDACSALSSAGDIVLADLSKYVVGLRADATIRRDDSRYFDSDEIAFRLTLRVDGQPQDATAQKLRDGTNTVSPFVTLGAR